jgi:hypothetical protein
MSWFPDMAHESMVAEGEHVRAVGWLDANQPYTRGSVPPEFVIRLREFVRLSSDSASTLYFGAFAGFHTCEFCGQAHDSRNFGVPAGDLLFVAPAMIGHYIEQHGYAPPAEFITAVANSPLPDTPEYRVACEGFRELHKRLVAELVREQQKQADRMAKLPERTSGPLKALLVLGWREQIWRKEMTLPFPPFPGLGIRIDTYAVVDVDSVVVGDLGYDVTCICTYEGDLGPEDYLRSLGFERGDYP